MNLELLLSEEGVGALRDFSYVCPIIMRRLSDSTDELLRVFENCQGHIGPHEAAFEELLQEIKIAIISAGDSIEDLRMLLCRVADEIENFIRGESSDGSQKVKRR